MSNRAKWWQSAGLLALSLLVAGCETAPGTLDQSALPSPTRELSSLDQSALPSPTPAPTVLPTVAAPTATPTPTQSPAVQLIVLHTNDNWGETEPCG